MIKNARDPNKHLQERRCTPDSRPSHRTPKRAEGHQKKAGVDAWRTRRPELNRLAVRGCTTAGRRNRAAVDCARVVVLVKDCFDQKLGQPFGKLRTSRSAERHHAPHADSQGVFLG